jgi:CheY-like chemotaxis protein
MRYKSCRPLVVEDDSDYRLLLLRAFAKAGVPGENVRATADGEEALGFLGSATEKDAPSLVVLDLNLPGMSGLEILAWIRGSSRFPDVPAFLLTSSEEPEHVGRAYDLRTDSYFVKPREFHELSSCTVSVPPVCGLWCTTPTRSSAWLLQPAC